MNDDEKRLYCEIMSYFLKKKLKGRFFHCDDALKIVDKNNIDFIEVLNYMAENKNFSEMIRPDIYSAIIDSDKEIMMKMSEEFFKDINKLMKEKVNGK
jgi:hypothetical protein